MLELLQYRSWAIADTYFARMFPIVSEAIVRGHNLIEKKSIEDYQSRIEALVNVVDPSTDRIRVLMDYRTGKTLLPVAQVGNRNIAIIPIMGPITKYGDACSIGTQEYQRYIGIANADPEIHGIVLLMDTPGGTVDGTVELAQAVKNSPKPVGVFGDGMVASAGLWIASQAAVIVGNKNNPTEFGSIGVLVIDQDWTKVEEAGNQPKLKIIRADGSDEKALFNPIEPTTDEIMTGIKASLNSVRAAFISTVKSGRGEKLNAKTEGLFNGRMFSAQDSKKAGLIDTVGDLRSALSKVAELSRQQSKGTTGSQGPNANNQMNFKKTAALLGAAWASLFHSGSEANSSLTPEQIASLEASEKSLADADALTAQLKADNEAHTKKIGELEKTVSEQTAQITALEGEKKTLTEENAKQKAELEKKPTGTATTVIAGKGEEAQAADQGASATTQKGKFHTSVDDEVAKYQSQINPVK
jgi:protease IV